MDRKWQMYEKPVNLRIDVDYDAGIVTDYHCPKCDRWYYEPVEGGARTIRCKCGQLLCLRIEPTLEELDG